MAITLKVYKDSEEYEEYRNARFPKTGKYTVGTPATFEFKGHRWKYQVTSFDDNGDYDLLWRPDGSEPELMASDATLRDYFAAKYMGGCGVNPQSDAYFITADLAYKMADAMLKARG
ncbi:hypothetical protein AB7W10_06055 [Providencia rettgeri]